MMLIGISGAAGAGKDSAADHLIKNFNFVKTSFADPLYQEVADSFGVTVDFLRKRDTKELPQPELALKNCDNEEFINVMAAHGHSSMEEHMSPRTVMQFWGTQYRRYADINYWTDKLKKKLNEDPDGYYVIGDVRFDNEALSVMDMGGILIRIDRDVSKVKEHESERGLNEHYLAAIVDNNMDFEHLNQQMNGIFYQYDNLGEEVKANLSELINNNKTGFTR